MWVLTTWLVDGLTINMNPTWLIDWLVCVSKNASRVWCLAKQTRNKWEMIALFLDASSYQQGVALISELNSFSTWSETEYFTQKPNKHPNKQQQIINFQRYFPPVNIPGHNFIPKRISPSENLITENHASIKFWSFSRNGFQSNKNKGHPTVILTCTLNRYMFWSSYMTQF